MSMKVLTKKGTRNCVCVGGGCEGVCVCGGGVQVSVCGPTVEVLAAWWGFECGDLLENHHSQG